MITSFYLNGEKILKKKKGLTVLMFLLLLWTILPTVPNAIAKPTAATTTVIIGTSDKIINLDPADCYDYFSSNILVQLTHGVMEMPIDSTDAEPGPIVESWSVNTEADEYIFVLKEDIKFSDGADFNATALKWNLERSIALNGDPGFLLADVINTVDVVNNSAVKITLGLSDATFLQRLTYTVAWPISPDGLLEVDTISGDPDHIPNGLGPYMVDTWTKDTEIILVPNPHYFGTAPENEKVVIKFYASASALLLALESGEIDVAHRIFGPDEMKSVKANPDIASATKATAGIRYLMLNCQTGAPLPYMSDVRVRRAIASAVDRAEICNVVYDDFNEPLFSMVPEIFSSHIDAFEDGPNMDNVEGNMTAAGYSTTNKYEIDLWYTPSHYGSTEADVAQLLQAQLIATGYFDVELQAAEWSAYKEGWGTMPFFLLGWWFDYPDPSNYIDPFAGAGSFSLGTNYSTTEMDGLITDMLSDPDVADRTQAQIDAQSLLASDVPVIPLFTMLSQFIARQPNVAGVTLEPSENVHYNSIKVTEVEVEPTTTATSETEEETTTEAADGAPGFELLVTFVSILMTGVFFTKKKRKC